MATSRSTNSPGRKKSKTPKVDGRKVNSPSEKQEEKVIIDLYKTVGCAVIKFSQAQKSMQTPGIPDLLVFHKSGRWWWHEVKRLQGPRYKTVAYGQTDYQKQFQLLVEAAGHTYLCGPRDVAMDMLQEIGAISAQSEGGHRTFGR